MEFCMAPRQKFKPNNQRAIHTREPTNYRVFVYNESYLSLCHCPLTMAKCITDPAIASVCAITETLCSTNLADCKQKNLWCMCADVAQQAFTPLVLEKLIYHSIPSIFWQEQTVMVTCYQMYPALSATQIFCFFRQTKFSSLHQNLRSWLNSYM